MLPVAGYVLPFLTFCILAVAPGAALKLRKQAPVADFSPDDIFLKEFVYVDPAKGHHATAKGHHQLVGPSRVPYVEELSRVILSQDGERHEPTMVHPHSTAVYLGVSGTCLIELVPHITVAAVNISVSRGRTITVFPGVRHRAILAGDGTTCELVYLHLASGDYSWSNVQGWLQSDYDELVDEATAHDSDKLSKRVFIRAGVVPGLFQFSVARFSPGAVCPEHTHPSASEVYINYFGPGCHMRAVDGEQRDRSFDLTGGKVAILNPGTRHSAWNAHEHEACWNVNVMVGNPNAEPLPPPPHHKAAE